MGARGAHPLCTRAPQILLLNAYHAVYQTGPSKSPGNMRIVKTISQYLVKANVVMRCCDMPKRM